MYVDRLKMDIDRPKTAIKFSYNGLEGIFLRLSLTCPVCDTSQAYDSIGFLLGEGRTLPDAAEEIRRELCNEYADCRHCGSRSAIIPDDVKPNIHKWIAENITGEWYMNASISSISPSRVRGVCIN